MNLLNNKTNFSHLLSSNNASVMRRHLTQLKNGTEDTSDESSFFSGRKYLEELRKEWQGLSAIELKNAYELEVDVNSEKLATDWLIKLFNALFADQQVVLARSNDEPEYFPAQGNKPARIEFAHGFFASALHEISHWCVAGDARRRLPDFGYWYAPDGRSAAQQQAFERVEIKPQALECLFTLACGRHFQVSQDNLFANFDTSASTFTSDVYQQVKSYIANPHTLPRDAKTLLTALLSVCMTE